VKPLDLDKLTALLAELPAQASHPLPAEVPLQEAGQRFPSLTSCFLRRRESHRRSAISEPAGHQELDHRIGAECLQQLHRLPHPAYEPFTSGNELSRKWLRSS
jgi:hypothetical protein